MENEQYIESGLSVGAVKYVDPNEIITEEEYNYIKNKTPELDRRVGVIENEIDEINSSLDNITQLKPNKNEVRFNNVLIELKDLSTEVKQSMTGGSVAVVGKDSVGSENIKNNSISIDKVNFIDGGNLFNGVYSTLTVNGGKVTKMNDVNSIVLDLKPQTTYIIDLIGKRNRFSINLSNSISVGTTTTLLYNHVSDVLTSAFKYEFTNENNFKYAIITLSYDLSDFNCNTFIKEKNIDDSFKIADVKLIRKGCSEVDTNDIKNNSISIDKVNFIDGGNLFTEYSNMYGNGGVLSTDVDVRSIVVELKNIGVYYIQTEGMHNRFYVYGFNSLELNTKGNLLYNSGTNSDISNIENYEFVNDGTYKYIVITISYGLQSFNAMSSIKYNSKSIKLCDEEVITKNNISDYLENIKTNNNFYSSVPRETPTSNISQLYSLYDELSEKYPNYVKKNVLGNDGVGNELIEYTFGGKNYNDFPQAPRTKDSIIEKPIILITSGVHGEEKSAIVSAYKFLKDLTENKNSCLSELRERVIIKIIPFVCPSAYNENTRKNHNGVDIARNFSYNWVSISNPSNNYSGEYPADQLETQIVEKWIADNKTSLVFIDFHNSGYENEVTYFACTTGTEYEKELKTCYFKAINKVGAYWRNEYKLPEGINLGYTGHFDNLASPQMFAHSIGLKSISFESSWQQKYANDKLHGTISNAMGADYLGNFLIELVNKYVDI